MVPKLPHPLSLTLLSAAYLTGRTAVNLPEHTHKQLIIIKTMPFLQLADRQICIQQIRINMSYSRCLMCGYRLTIHWI